MHCGRNHVSTADSDRIPDMSMPMIIVASYPHLDLLIILHLRGANIAVISLHATNDRLIAFSTTSDILQGSITITNNLIF